MTEREWRVERKTTILKAVAAGVFVVLAVFVASDVPGRVLGFGVAAALTAFVVRDLVAPVRLAADAQGVTVVTGFSSRRQIPWSEVERVRVDTQRRLGRRIELLEIDTAERLHLLSASDLGTDCDEVADALTTLRTGR